METAKRRFETETCGRCAGTGKHSYNMIHGDVCYGCGGKGIRRTKRGEAAFLHYRDLCTKDAADVVVGDCIDCCGRVGKVEEIEAGEQSGESLRDGVMVPYCYPTVTFHCNNGGTTVLLTGQDNERRIVTHPNGDDKLALLAAAYDYQETLTAAGKPAKRKAVAVS
jgi:hypothetical protein